MLRSTLYKAQKKAVRLYENKRELALFMEPGTGKTITAFGMVDKKQRRKNSHLLVLVVCPKNIIGSWEDELNLHMDDYNFFDSLDSFENTELDESISYTFVVINYEQARIHIERLRQLDFDFVIVDESHRIKNRKAKITKALWQLKHIRYKIIMSGTPITKDEIDLWAQFKFLNSRIWGNDFKTFTQKALTEIDRGSYRILKPNKKKLKPFMDKAAMFTYQVKLDEMVELPPMVNIPVHLNLRGAAKKAYRELEKGFLTEYQGKRSSHSLNVTGMLRLQQLTGGHLTLETNDVVRMKEQAKLLWIIDKLEDIGKEKMIIFCRFTLEIELISAALKKLGYKHVIMKGGMTNQQTNKVRKQFQNDKSCQVLIGQIASVKEGNNFQTCRYGVFYSKSMSFVEIEQCRRRLYRNGQRRKVLLYHLIMKNTIDEPIETVIDMKFHNAEDALLKLIIKGRHTMSKEASSKKAAVAKKPTKRAPPQIERPEFGIEALADAMGLDNRTVRIKLRNAKVEKDGKFYNFNNASGVKAMAKQLEAAAAPAKKAEKKPAEKKPAAKAKPTASKKAA